MKKIDSLLEKYIAGETTLQEENQLKDFLSETSDSKYQIDKLLFSSYQELSQEKILSKQFEKIFMSKIRYRKSKKRVYRFASISAAASIVFIVGFLTFSPQKEAYVIENGVRIDDTEKAVGYADEAINEAIFPVKNSMKLLEPIMGLEGTLKPIHTVSDTSVKVNIEKDSMYGIVN